jgi:hypothetical protein
MTTDNPPAICASPAPTALENALGAEMVLDALWTNAWLHSTGGTPHTEQDPLARPIARCLACMLAEAGAVQFGLRLIPASPLKNVALGFAVAGEGLNVARNLRLSFRL